MDAGVGTAADIGGGMSVGVAVGIDAGIRSAVGSGVSDTVGVLVGKGLTTDGEVTVICGVSHLRYRRPQIVQAPLRSEDPKARYFSESAGDNLTSLPCV